MEYVFAAPSLIEFRFCPPYNRMRYASLLLILVLMIYLGPDRILEGRYHAAVSYLSKLCLNVWNFQYSPVPAMAVVLGGGDPDNTIRFGRMAALALSVSVFYAAAYVVLSRGFCKHLECERFNLYLNLPAAALYGQALPRRQLRALGWLSLLAGLTLPFYVPVLLNAISDHFSLVGLTQGQLMIWTLALWAWVPGVALLRGVALHKISRLPAPG
jgi:hypothetical protein